MGGIPRMESRMTDLDHLAANAAARERVLALASRLSDEQLARPFDDGWTVAAGLVHLAFWDRTHTTRLRAALESGDELPAPLPRDVIDAINNSGLHGWRLIGGREAVQLFGEISAGVDAYLATLDAPTVARIRAAGIPRHVEQFRHRDEHANAMERALGET